NARRRRAHGRGTRVALVAMDAGARPHRPNTHARGEQPMTDRDAAGAGAGRRVVRWMRSATMAMCLLSIALDVAVPRVARADNCNPPPPGAGVEPLDGASVLTLTPTLKAKP